MIKTNTKKNKNILKITYLIIIFLALLLAGYLRITDYGINKLSLTHLAQVIAILIFIVCYILLWWALIIAKQSKER